MILFIKVQTNARGGGSHVFTWSCLFVAPCPPAHTGNNHHNQYKEHCRTDWNHYEPNIFFYMQQYFNLSQVDSLRTVDLNAVLARVIFLQICDLECPIVDEKLCPVFVRLMNRYLSIVQGKHAHRSGRKLFLTHQQESTGVGHQLDVYRSSKNREALRSVTGGIALCISSLKESLSSSC